MESILVSAAVVILLLVYVDSTFRYFPELSA